MYTSQTLSTLAVAMLAMAPAVQSHMIMASPKPFGNPNNSPLDPSGSDYPCKITGGAAGEGPKNDFKVGSTQQLSFTGSAVHGGGSCQLAVTTDKNPTKDSKFKVIHSIEGGCPGVATGSPSTFEFQVPDALPNGEAVFAWSWFNHIGNREMYMNCAYITISGGKDDTSAFEALPDLALANINVGSGASCKTSEGADYTFQGVGKAGDTVDKVGSGPFKDLCGGEASAGEGTGSGSGAGAGSSAGGAAPAPSSGAGAGTGSGAGGANNGQYTPGPGEGGAAQTPAASAPAASAPAATAAPGAPPAASGAPVLAPGASGAVTSTVHTLVTVTGAPSASAPAAAPIASSAPVASAAPTQAPAASAPAAAPAPSGGAAAGGSSCSTNGALVCNGASQFGICNNGQVVWQAVAAGTTCSDGKVQKRAYTHRAQRTAIY